MLEFEIILITKAIEINLIKSLYGIIEFFFKTLIEQPVEPLKKEIQ